MKKIEFDSNRDIKQLHEKYKVPEGINIFYLNYQLDKDTNEWVFHGYRCVKCERMFKKPETLPNHVQSCHILKRTKKYGVVEISDEATVINKNREVWSPFEMNQKKS